MNIKKSNLTLLAVTVISTLSACSTTKVSEAEMIAEMTTILQDQMAKDYKVGATKRDAHPKTLGLLTAKMRVVDDIPIELQTEMFQVGKS